jgi:hypothetical protein
VTDRGPIYGRQAIEKLHADDFQRVHVSNHLITLDQDSPHIIGTAGNEIWATGGWSETIKDPYVLLQMQFEANLPKSKPNTDNGRLFVPYAVYDYLAGPYDLGDSLQVVCHIF